MALFPSTISWIISFCSATELSVPWNSKNKVGFTSSPYPGSTDYFKFPSVCSSVWSEGLSRNNRCMQWLNYCQAVLHERLEHYIAKLLLYFVQHHWLLKIGRRQMQRLLVEDEVEGLLLVTSLTSGFRLLVCLSTSIHLQSTVHVQTCALTLHRLGQTRWISKLNWLDFVHCWSKAVRNV